MLSRDGVTACSSRDDALTADAAVIATGAWLPSLAGRWLDVPVRAGRGYSFTVPVDRTMPCPIYLPDVRVACTPYKGAMRVSGTMEFRYPDEPGVPARADSIVASARPLLHGVRWGARTGVRGAEVADTEVYSVQSSLGAAIAGARPGEQRSYRTPTGVTMSVTLLDAVSYGLRRSEYSS